MIPRPQRLTHWLDELGYRLCWHRGWLAFQWSRVWYHFRCPYPIIKDHSAQACTEAGHCGCDNGPRLRAKHNGMPGRPA